MAAGVHPDVSTALITMLMEHVGVPLLYLAVILIIGGIALNWIQRNSKDVEPC